MSNKFKNLFTKEIDIKVDLEILINFILYSVILILPFIVVNFSYPRYLVGKQIFLYSIGFLAFITLILVRPKKIKLVEIVSGLFLLTIFIPTTLSPEKSIALFGNTYRGEGFIIYFIYINLFVLSSRYFKINERLLDIILVSACIMSIYGVIQFYGFDPVQMWAYGYIDSLNNSFGLIGNRNFFSSYICIFLFISTAMHILKGGKKYLIYGTILFSGLICSLTRGGWLGFLIFAIVGVFFIIKDKVKIKRAIVVFLLFSAVFFGINITNNNSILSRADNTVTKGDDGEIKINDSGRIEILKISMRAFLDKPLIGWGPDTLSERLSADYPKEYEEHLASHNSFIDKAHNEFLEYAVSNGIFNLIAYLTLIGITIYNLWSNIKETKVKVLFLTLIGYLFQSFFNISVIMVAPIFWVFLGYCNSDK